MKRIFAMLLLAAMFTVATPVLADSQEPSQVMDAKPDAMAKYKENLPASRFVLIAYGVVWTGLFLYLISLHRRQAVMEKRLAELEPIFAEMDKSSGANNGE